MICSGLKKNKLSLQQARAKYEEFVEFDLIDEDHQEEIEDLLAEMESDEYYWTSARKEYIRSRNDYVDGGDELDEDNLEDEERYEDDEEDR